MSFGLPKRKTRKIDFTNKFFISCEIIFLAKKVNENINNYSNCTKKPPKKLKKIPLSSKKLKKKPTFFKNSVLVFPIFYKFRK